MQLCRRVGILAEKGPDDPVADLAAVFLVGLGQHKDVLGHAAPGGDIAPAETGADQLLQVFHAPVQAALGQLFAGGIRDGKQADVYRVPAAGRHGPPHGK